MSDIEEVLVIGGGAAGLNAALVLARARRRVLVVDSGRPRNAPAHEVHGFLTRDGTPPGELLAIGRAEVERYGGRIVRGTVRALRRTDNGFEADLADRTVRARRVIMAAGLTDELPDLPGVRERFGRDVLHCPYCHGWEVRDEPLGVLATEPTAIHQALLVSQWSADMILFAGTVSDADRARLTARGVRIVEEKVTGLVITDDKVTGVTLADGRTVARAALFVQTRMIPNDGLLAAVGFDPDAPIDRTGRTNVPGLWAAGNVVDPSAQVISSAAGGALAAAMINMDLIEEDVELSGR